MQKPSLKQPQLPGERGYTRQIAYQRLLSVLRRKHAFLRWPTLPEPADFQGHSGRGRRLLPNTGGPTRHKATKLRCPKRAAWDARTLHSRFERTLLQSLIQNGAGERRRGIRLRPGEQRKTMDNPAASDERHKHRGERPMLLRLCHQRNRTWGETMGHLRRGRGMLPARKKGLF